MRHLLILLVLCTGIPSSAQTYLADVESLDKRPIPEWYNEAKFGIFIVWGPYSVPSYTAEGYAEWYWMDIRERKPDSREFHNRVYGEDFKYEQFADMFTAELWDPDLWCDLFVRSGARYVVTTANYHDGFAMYPTEYSKTESTDRWNSMVRGPGRDIIGELKEAGDKRDLKMGIYYSLYEWYHPLWLNDKQKFVTEHFHPKFKELVDRYEPWFIFLDGDWKQSYTEWKSEELAAWLYNESACKDFVVTNDRWGMPHGLLGDVFESEYGGGKYTSPLHPWQEDRGIGESYGFNRMETIDDYDTRDELVRMLSNVTGGGGNFLLCVGPTADGRIPVIMQERLLQTGEWLDINGEAIYGSNASPFWPRQFDWGTVTCKPEKLYLHIHDHQKKELTIRDFGGLIHGAELLHPTGPKPVSMDQTANSFSIHWDNKFNDPAVTVIVLDVSSDFEVSRVPRQFSSGELEFNCRAMEIHGGKAKVNYWGYSNLLSIVDWEDPAEYVSADFIIDKPGEYIMSIIYAAEQEKGVPGSSVIIEVARQEFSYETEGTGSWMEYEEFDLGPVKFEDPGKFTISVRPVRKGWNGFLFQGIRFRPAGLK